ncbi:MAG: hypothetical protein QXX77_01375 [Candidatus Methanosuratincola sp.]
MGVIITHNIMSLYGILSIASVYQIVVFHSFISKVIGDEYYFSFLSALFFISVFFMFLGAIARRKIQKTSHLAWNLLGILFAVSIFFRLEGILGLIIYSTLGGIAAGLCIPDVVCYLMEITNFENRGATSGLFIFSIYLIIFFSSTIISSAFDLAIFLVVLKAVSILLISIRPFQKAKIEEPAFIKHPLRVPLLYMFVWFLFLLVDVIVSNMASQKLTPSEIFTINLESVLLGLAAMLIGGALADNVGRRKLIIFAYLYLGIEYSFISLSSGDLIRYTFIDGIAWGILSTLFLLVIWGDVGSIRVRPIYSAAALTIGIASIYFKNIIPVLGFRYDLTQAFPLTSIFLFLSVVITSFILPETLPEKVIQSRELRDYIETAMKIREKYA